MSDNQNPNNGGWFKTGNRKIIALVAGSAIVVGSVLGVQAMTSSKTFQHVKLEATDGNWHKAGWFGGGRGGGHGWGHRGRFADMSDAEIQDRIERMVKHVAIEIDATDDQTQKITTLVTAVAKELKPMRDKMRAAGKQVHDLLLQDTIDRAALETVRAERLADAEQISKTIVNAVADVAEVLTPDQRQVLEKRIQEFRSHKRGWGRGWRRG